MYINFKIKYKKIFWVLFGFLFSCIFVHKVYAIPTFNNYDFNNFSFTYGNYSYNKDSILQLVSEQIEARGKSLDDYPYIYIVVPTIPTTNSSQPEYRNSIYIQLTDLSPLSYYSATSNNYWYYSYSNEFTAMFVNISFVDGIIRSGGPYTIDSVTASYTTTPSAIKGGTSSSNSVKVYTNVNFGSLTDGNTNISNVYTRFLYDPNMLSTEPPLPSYLQGYKKITLTSDDKYVMLSGLSSGSVYIPTQDFDEYGGRLSYYDNDLDSQPYTSYIQDYYKMPDGEFIRQDFDLSQFYGADWVMFSKYIYLEGEDDISYDIYVPDDIYDSLVTITPNSATGGNDFDFEYKDENGDIQSEQVQSVDLSQDNPLLGNIFSDFSSNTFGLTSIITAPLSLIRSLSSTSCTPLNLPLPFVGGTLTLPCMYSFYSSTFGTLFTLYQTITFGIVAYWVMVRIFNMVKDFKNPDHDEIEVIDL